MVNDDNDYKLDVYRIDTRTKLDKKRIFIMVATYIVVIIYSYLIRNYGNIFLNSLVQVIH